MRSQIKMRVPARDDEGQNRELQVVVSLLPFLKQHSMDVSFEVVDGNQRLVEREGQRLSVTDADEQGSGQAGALRDRDGVDRFVSVLGFGERLADDWDDGAQMLARG